MSIVAIICMLLLAVGFVLKVLGKNALLWDVAVLVVLLLMLAGLHTAVV